MKITNIICSTKNDKIVLSAQLVLDTGRKHDIYFEVDKKFKSFLSKDANPFFPLALPISMRKKEDITLNDEISSTVISKTSKIMSILKSWNTGFNTISIRSKNSNKNVSRMNNVGCFFSGGVDSFYTYLKNRNKINYLIFVHGFDIPANDLVLYKKIEKNITQIAKEENVKLLKVRTNLRETLELYFDWDMAHEFALASASLFLRRGFKELYMSCGQTDIGADHHYMTPDLDILWSTENMKINHYGCSADKIAKLKFLSNYKLVMENLRVCWVNKKNQYNCCECEKCFRNMLALYASGALTKCKTFKKNIDIEKLKKIQIDEYDLKYFITVLKYLKAKNDTSDIRFALEACIKNNSSPNVQKKLEKNIRYFIGRLDKQYNRNRLFWFLSARGLL